MAPTVLHLDTYHTQSQTDQSSLLPVEVDVVVIGNGPAGIFTSFLLHGNYPYYNGTIPHPDPILHAKLSERANVSIVNQDLPDLTSHLLHTPLASRSSNPVSLLVDTLFHPNADTNPGESSRLSWRSEPWRAYSHVVLGRGEVGGVWAEMKNSDARTVSYAENMDLPEMSYADWWNTTHIGSSDTVFTHPLRSDVARYYQDYVHSVGIADAFHSHTNITQVITVEEAFALGWCACSDFKNRARRSPESTAGWQCETCVRFNYIVCGYSSYDKNSKFPFAMRAMAVVLATGIFEKPKWLENVEGEDATFVLHNLKDIVAYDATRDEPNSQWMTNSCHQLSMAASTFMRSLVPKTMDCVYSTPPISPKISAQPNPVVTTSPYLIVGSGLSAADAIIHLRSLGVPVIHVFHHPTARQPHQSTSPLASYTRLVYPDYAGLYRQMKRSAGSGGRQRIVEDSGYEGLVNARVISIRRAEDEKIVMIEDETGRVFTQAVCGVGILIGRKIGMGFLKGQSREQIIASREETDGCDNKNDAQAQSDNEENKVSQKHILQSRRASLDITISSPLRKVDPYSFRAAPPTRTLAQKEPRLYAVGALTGDTFVRFVLGGGLGVMWNLEKWLGMGQG